MAKVGLEQYDATPANNTDVNGINVGEGCPAANINNALRQMMADTFRSVGFKGADYSTSATTSIDVGIATGYFIDIAGVAGITGLGVCAAGTRRLIRFRSAQTLTHNATSLILPGGANITTASGDVAEFVSLGGGNWVCIAYSKASGGPITLAPYQGAIGASGAGVSGLYFGSSDDALDNYDEGTWTPTLIGASTAGTQTYSVQIGRYIRVGDLVWVLGSITLSAKDGATSGALRISGLPFAALALIGGSTPIAIQNFGNFDLNAASGYYFPMANVQQGQSYISLNEGGDNNSPQALTEADFGNASSIVVAGCYRV